ncbi:hypothetical protein BGX24_004032 [Mortierella sp. AD032]|nr:hypothetical protein BGX24_004032 [Mortierella sp. AD032]
MLAKFDLNTLVHPANQALLTKQRARGKKLVLDKVDADASDAFTAQVDDALCNYSQLLEAPVLDKFPEAYGHGAEMTAFTSEYLQVLSLDRVWNALRGAIMDSALAHLPSVKTGGLPPPPDGEGRIREKISDLGNIIRTVRDVFESTGEVEKGLQETTHQQLRRWYVRNGETMDVSVVPEVSASMESWKQWRKEVQKHWRQSRLEHQDYIAANKQDIINAHIENRDLSFASDTRKTIRSILEVYNGRVNLDHLIIDGVDGPYVEDDPAEIKREVREYFEETFHKARPTGVLSEEWAKAYRPREDIEEEWYAPVMSIPDYKKVCEAIGVAPKVKAAGISGVTGDLLKRLGPVAQALFVALVQACFVQVAMPEEWMKGIIYCIPKGSIFKGPNFSVLKGTMTKDPIHILNAVMEDAREYKKEAWVLLQDMRRCFDSVSCAKGGMLELGMKHLRIPQEFIDLCLLVAANKSNQVITTYGLTEPYNPRCGLDQGGVECPLLWRIAYEALLARVWEDEHGYLMTSAEAIRDFHKIPSWQSVYLDTPLLIACLAFMDDVTEMVISDST